MFSSHRNYSINLQIKLVDWFLYDENIERKELKKLTYT